jgi:Mg2+ and Co2+ transporter CorA
MKDNMNIRTQLTNDGSNSVKFQEIISQCPKCGCHDVRFPIEPEIIDYKSYAEELKEELRKKDDEIKYYFDKSETYEKRYNKLKDNILNLKEDTETNCG